MERIFAKLLYEMEKERDTVLVTIIADQGSTSRGAGAQMLVEKHGRILGSIGCGHCAQALAPLLRMVGFRVTVFDDRAEYANRENFPTAEKVLVGDYTKLSDHFRFTPDDYLGSFLNQVVAVILTKAASRPCAVPEEAPTAIVRLIRGILFLLHIQTSNHRYFSGMPGNEKRAFIHPRNGGE